MMVPFWISGYHTLLPSEASPNIAPDDVRNRNCPFGSGTPEVIEKIEPLAVGSTVIWPPVRINNTVVPIESPLDKVYVVAPAPVFVNIWQL